jgi:UDP-4-amino-4,6-dideoxy-N-acetyl-beta-L-altrosamine transaminase
MKYIPYGRQSITEQDRQSVISVLESDYLTQGPIVGEFESLITKYTGAKYTFATNSGTSALHIACLALGLKQGEWLWSSAITFVASANCGLYCGAKVDFIDIETNTGNIDVDKLEKKLRRAKRVGKLPKIVVAVHFAGQPCNIKRIRQLSHEYGFFVIEDACHALGATFEGKKIGSCQYSDICIFSFHPVKMITTGEGGMALTNDADLAWRLDLHRNHGITKDQSHFIANRHEPWVYEQQMLGYNYRMSDIHAALGKSQFLGLDKAVEKRLYLADRYQVLLDGLPFTPLKRTLGCSSSWHIFVITVNDEATIDRLGLYNFLKERNIGVCVHYQPVYQQPYFRNAGLSQTSCPGAEAYYAKCITLPLFVSLALEDQDFVVESLKEALKFGLTHHYKKTLP